MFTRVAIIISLLTVTVFYAFWQKRSFESQLVPAKHSQVVLKKLPEAQFDTLDGEPFNLDAFYQNEGVELLVVHFWGTWCAPCEAELPDLLRFMDGLKSKPGVKFLLVAVNDDVIKVKKHIKAQPVPKDAQIHWLLDNKNLHKDLFGTTRVPETFVFSSDKSTLRKYVGPQEWNKPMFFQSFDEFLQISTRKL